MVDLFERLLDVVVEHVDQAKWDEDQETRAQEEARTGAQGPPRLGDDVPEPGGVRGGRDASIARSYPRRPPL